ncbi:cytosolic sulfotransferase 15-like [Neltuma alba]|uniref:cytosolic sulfotransferase 15-like n=1 Tax=Neltuma alba TaxID=207710 RepID=UPI0010A4603A|nr:cytosolic sulfotransferase 15-like [Prosopis alba]
MAETSLTKSHSNVEFNDMVYDEEYENLGQEYKELVLSLPREKGWVSSYIYLNQELWYGATQIQAISLFHKQFQAKDSDIIIASTPKSGTTWLKALVFAIVNRNCFSPSQNNHPLLISNPHELVPFFEFYVCENNQIPDLSDLPEPRLFGTHVPFHSLPDSITKSKCKIIYICRNPFDNFVSFWFFYNKIVPPPLRKLSREEAFERYIKGNMEFGPFWTNILGYWKQSKETPTRVLFLKYNDLKRDIKYHLKTVADFLGFAFSMEEESNGVIESISELCSFEKMKGLEANKTGKVFQRYETKNFFRKGEVGDWVNHFSPWMEERLSRVIEEKLRGSGLSF